VRNREEVRLIKGIKMKGKVRTVRCKAFGCPFPFLNNKCFACEY